MWNRLRRASVVLASALAALPACGGKEERVLHLAIWDNYIPAGVVEDFEKQNHCTVEISKYGSNDELLAILKNKNTGYDVAVPSENYLKPLIALGLIERLDKTKIPNRSHLDPAFTHRESDPNDDWAVPYAWGTVGIAWRADKLGEDVESWAAIADPRAEKNAFLLEEKRDVIAAALLYKGHDVNTLDPAHLAEAKAVLLEWKPHLKSFTGEVKDALLSGNAWVLEAYNGDVAQARRERKDVRFAVPKEGGVLWTDNLVIPLGAPERDLAHAFLNAMLDPAVAARFSSELQYAVPNKDALPLVDPAVRNDPVVYAPPEVLKRCWKYKDLGRNDEAYSKVWTDVKGGK